MTILSIGILGHKMLKPFEHKENRPYDGFKKGKYAHPEAASLG
jgi:hypothetical protein